METEWSGRHQSRAGLSETPAPPRPDARATRSGRRVTIEGRSYDRRTLAEAQKDLAAWISRWQAVYPRLCDWVEENIAETFTFYLLPLGHHKHLKITNLLERFNEEIKRRTRVVRIFPNRESCLRLIRALAAETHEGWLEEHRYLNMQLWAEHKREQLRRVEEAA